MGRFGKYLSESSQIQELEGRRDLNRVGICQESAMTGHNEGLPGSWKPFCQCFDTAARETCLDFRGMAKRLLRREKP